MPYKGGVQLLPETQRRPTFRSYTSGNSYFYFAVFLGAIILVVGAMLGGYKRSLTEKIDVLDAQMAASEKTRVVAQEKELIAASKQSQVMKQLLAGKLYWTQAFARIEKIMQSTVVLTGLDADANKATIAFQATADSYASVARQLASFAAASGVSDVTVDKIESTQDGQVSIVGTIQLDTKAVLLKTGATPTPTPRP